MKLASSSGYTFYSDFRRIFVYLSEELNLPLWYGFLKLKVKF